MGHRMKNRTHAHSPLTAIATITITITSLVNITTPRAGQLVHIPIAQWAGDHIQYCSCVSRVCLPDY